MTAKYIVVTGSVAAGATTVANLILDRWDGTDLLEGQIEQINPFFKDAQEDPHRWSFASQAHFLAASAARHRELRSRLEGATGFVVEDRTPFEHHGAYSLSAYESGYLSEREYALLSDLAREIEPGYLVPDVVVYREMTQQQLVERVKSRGREGESDDPKRLAAIHAAFETFIDDWNRSPLVRVPSEVDVFEPEGEAFVVQAVAKYLGPPAR